MIRQSILAMPWIYLELGRAGALSPGFFLTSPDTSLDLAVVAPVPDMAR